MIRSALAAAVLAWMIGPAALTAQYAVPADDAAPGSMQRDVALLSVNALIGGVTAGVGRALGGGSFAEGFAGGALGGAVVFAGKRTAAARFDGAGLVGRQVAGIGSSMIASVAAERPLLAETDLQLGPARIRITDARGEPTLVPRLDLLATVSIVHAVATPGLRFDPRRSLSSGAAVFVSPDHAIRTRFGDGFTATGLALPGTILLGPVQRQDAHEVERVFAHERIHLLQYDQVQITWSRGAEAGLARRIRFGPEIRAHLDLGLVLAALVPAAILLPHEDQPWEWEAHGFAPRP